MLASGILLGALALLAFVVLYWLYSRKRAVKIKTGPRRHPPTSSSPRHYYPRAPSRERIPWDGTLAHAEYEGSCPRCGQSIRIGEEITWWSDRRGNLRWIHLKCR